MGIEKLNVADTIVEVVRDNSALCVQVAFKLVCARVCAWLKEGCSKGSNNLYTKIVKQSHFVCHYRFRIRFFANSLRQSRHGDDEIDGCHFSKFLSL